MEKNDIIRITVNNIDVEAIVIDVVANYFDDEENRVVKYLCYGQNRLFIMTKKSTIVGDESTFELTKVVCEYAILPEIDNSVKHYINN